MKKFGSAFHIS